MYDADALYFDGDGVLRHDLKERRSRDEECLRVALAEAAMDGKADEEDGGIPESKGEEGPRTPDAGSLNTDVAPPATPDASALNSDAAAAAGQASGRGRTGSEGFFCAPPEVIKAALDAEHYYVIDAAWVRAWLAFARVEKRSPAPGRVQGRTGALRRIFTASVSGCRIARPPFETVEER